MTALVSLDDLAIRLQLGDTISDINESLLTQLSSMVSVQLESILQTPFDRKARVDIFYLDSENDHPFPNDIPGVLLTAGFVDSSIAVTAREALTIADLASGDEIASADLLINYEEGLVQLVDGDSIGVVSRVLRNVGYDKTFVQVTYAAGFNVSGGVYADVPEWLRTLAINLIAETYLKVKDCDDCDTAKECKGVINAYHFMLEKYIRFKPWAYKPLHSATV